MCNLCGGHCQEIQKQVKLYCLFAVEV